MRQLSQANWPYKQSPVAAQEGVRQDRRAGAHVDDDALRLSQVRQGRLLEAQRGQWPRVPHAEHALQLSEGAPGLTSSSVSRRTVL